MPLQRTWQRVFQGANGLCPRRGVLEDIKGGVEQLVSFGDRNVDTKPVACGSEGCGSEVISREPRVDSRNRVRFGSYKTLNLI